ncbi:hypothetical protein [Actinomadura litoris]|uniref:Uncharacterized protein n=1 Tax=Actinomadura litoris TaxID=2678616 RepID=A0A7K1L3J0_9ACTN|nr:hypothetical protein [Actinomadura litoris]MUN38982.1 hypothetical protein [Actinomadura litoris]
MDSSTDVTWLGRHEALRFPPSGSTWAKAGWAAYFSETTREAGSHAPVLLRFGRHSNGEFAAFGPSIRAPLVVHELIVRVGAAGGTFLAALVRDLPFAQLEAAANLRVFQRTDPPGEDEFPFVNFAGPPRPLDGTGAEWTQFPDGQRRQRGPSLKLRVPPPGKRPDSFYEQVAERYLWLASQGPKPAEALARAQVDEVSPSTVHLWVREARRRGILPPGQRGKGTSPQEGQD